MLLLKKSQSCGIFLGLKHASLCLSCIISSDIMVSIYNDYDNIEILKFKTMLIFVYTECFKDLNCNTNVILMLALWEITYI